jgi:hypothetical protein
VKETEKVMQKHCESVRVSQCRVVKRARVMGERRREKEKGFGRGGRATYAVVDSWVSTEGTASFGSYEVERRKEREDGLLMASKARFGRK